MNPTDEIKQLKSAIELLQTDISYLQQEIKDLKSYMAITELDKHDFGDLIKIEAT